MIVSTFSHGRDALEELAAADRKRRPAAAPEQSAGAAETGRNVSRAALKKGIKVLYPPA
jgi:hypothetical protein